MGIVSAKQKLILAPFLIPPYYAGSSWAKRHGVAAGGAAAPVSPQSTSSTAVSRWPCVVNDEPLTKDWDSIDGKTAFVKIWWERGNQAEAQTAVAIRNIMDIAWPKYESLLQRRPLNDHGKAPQYPCRGGDDRIDFSIVQIARPNTIGYSGCSETPAYGFMPLSISPGNVAHELFHAFQYAFKFGTDGSKCDEYRWWREATAQWAEGYAMGASINNEEHAFAPWFFQDPGFPLEYGDVSNDSRWYGAFLFPLYLEHKVNPVLIATSFQHAASNDDSLKDVDGVAPFSTYWHDFSLALWNRAPFDYFNRWDPPFDASDERAYTSDINGTVHDSQIPVILDGSGNAVLSPNVEVEHLAARYFDFEVGSAGVRTLAFDSFMTDPAYIEGLGRLGSQWYDFGNWSISIGANPQYFCRDLSTEKLDELVLIVSNSSYDRTNVLQPDSHHPPTVVATNIGCNTWTGSFSGTEHWQDAASGEDLTASWSGNATFVRDSQFPTVLRSTSAAITWSLSGTLYSIDGTTCTESAGPAVLTAEPGSGEVDLSIGDPQHPRRYHVQVLHVDDVPATMTCTGGGPMPFTAHPKPAWLETAGDGFQVNDVNPSGTATGDAKATESDGGKISWHWTFSG